MIVTAVDPGHRWTAVVTRDTATGRDGLIARRVIDAVELPDRDLRTIVRAVQREVEAQHTDVGRVAPSSRVIAVEGMSGPTGFSGGERAPLDPGQLLIPASIVGAIVATWAAVIVPAGNHGPVMPNRAALLAEYPEALVGPRETTGRGKSPHQHARAAWDVAGATPAQIRIDRARRTA